MLILLGMGAEVGARVPVLGGAAARASSGVADGLPGQVNPRSHTSPLVLRPPFSLLDLDAAR